MISHSCFVLKLRLLSSRSLLNLPTEPLIKSLVESFSNNRPSSSSPAGYSLDRSSNENESSDTSVDRRVVDSTKDEPGLNSSAKNPGPFPRFPPVKKGGGVLLGMTGRGGDGRMSCGVQGSTRSFEGGELAGFDDATTNGGTCDVIVLLVRRSAVREASMASGR